MTLKQILELSKRVEEMPPALSCPPCQSVLKELPENRSCADAHIDAHWCTCMSYNTIDRKDTFAKKAVKFVIDYINTELDKNASNLCATLRFKSIISAKRSQFTDSNSDCYTYLLIFDVSPSNAKFETTVLYYPRTLIPDYIKITGSVSRLNEYNSQSACINSDYLRKYCYCLKQPEN